ncbi:MAG TPA: Maf family protein [Ktedonobacteraceae bacterium]|nr:Maf family protein [Ktedonobacteraceae bacterium]
MTTPPTQLLLASASPRRRQLLNLLGLPYELAVSPVDEDLLQSTYQGCAEELAEWTARQKALGATELLAARPEAVMITADTTVLLDNQELGKPRDEAHAFELLSSLRGRWHRVITGVVISRFEDGELKMHGGSCTTPVLMRPYSDEEIRAYIATKDPLDKAGAYGIQHPSFQPTERIQGCYLNVVGLPACLLVNLLAEYSIYPATRSHHATGCPWSERCLLTQESQ